MKSYGSKKQKNIHKRSQEEKIDPKITRPCVSTFAQNKTMNINLFMCSYSESLKFHFSWGKNDFMHWNSLTKLLYSDSTI